MAKRSNEMVFRTSCWQKKSKSSAIFYGTGSHVSPQQTGKSKYRTLRAICNIREETSNVEKLRATHEKKLHVQEISDRRGHDLQNP